MRSGPPAVLAALLRGEPVDPAAHDFRVAVYLETSAPRLAFLEQSLFVASAIRGADSVSYDGLPGDLSRRCYPPSLWYQAGNASSVPSTSSAPAWRSSAAVNEPVATPIARPPADTPAVMSGGVSPT